ncbi:hypothetical protein BJX63DRAFT_431991 [Aspergillus granulosus]|uniref:Uncharacterized protein n=1 Tax=Aspergillus granulosus TaxID=176169 RepID=A0ABR4HD47_9EURO
MLVQRYPTAYDGITASEPAQTWAGLTLGLYYQLLIKKWHDVGTLACELNFLTAEAVADVHVRLLIEPSFLAVMPYSPQTPPGQVQR